MSEIHYRMPDGSVSASLEGLEPNTTYRILLFMHNGHVPRCPVCNPRANPKPLGINGAEYRRRRSSR